MNLLALKLASKAARKKIAATERARIPMPGHRKLAESSEMTITDARENPARSGDATVPTESIAAL
jgi:hypothetical protein